MTISNQFGLISKKLNKHLKSALFLILPVALLFGLSTLITSQVSNYSLAIDKAIFKTIANQSTVIQITKVVNNQGGGFGEGGGGARQDRNFTSEDVTSISGIPDVTSTLVNYTLPINRVESTDLVADKTVDFQSLTVASENTAALFTKESFEYKEGDSVPIILNTNSLVESYEDWGGQDVIKIDLPARGQGGQQGAQTDFRAKFPNKTKPASIDKDKIVGQSFSINFGGLDKVQGFTQTPDFTTNSITFTKLTPDSLTTKSNETKSSVNKYWNYDLINKPLNYKFKVVGLISSDTNRSTYVPEGFTNSLMSNLIDNQLEARTATPIVNTELGVNYRGINYDGTYLQTAQGNNRFQGPGQGRPGQATTTPIVIPVTIPGLVINTDTNNTITGIGEDNTIFEKASKQAQTLTLKFNDISNREKVVQALNDKGYTYVDNGKFKVFSDLQNTLKNILNGTIIGFIILNLAILAFNVTKSIGDSRKEIGIFRALGFTKGQMITQYSLQSIIYTLIGLLVGGALGIASIFTISPFINEQFKGLIKDTITKTYGVTPEINQSMFTTINWNTIGLLAGVLSLIAIVISVLLSLRISNISPSEAIKG
jgi:ABC-type antimicrobial peptide transport system permease subunit